MKKQTIKRKQKSNKTKKYKKKQYGGNKIKTIEKNRYGEYEITFENDNYFEGQVTNISDQTNINQFTIDGNGLMVYSSGGMYYGDIKDNKSCTEGATSVNVERFANKLYENVETLFNYKYGDIPCEFMIGGCLVPDDPIKDNYILTFNESEKQDFLQKFNKIKDLLEINFVPFKINLDENNYPPQEIVNALNKKLQPTFEVNILSGEDIDDHQMILRSWGKEYDEEGNNIPVAKNRFCFKNTWDDSQNVCIDDIKEICKTLYKKTDIKSFSIQFEWLDFDLDKIQQIDNALYLNIIERINSLYNTI